MINKLYEIFDLYEVQNRRNGLNELLPEWWRERDDHWTRHFVSFKSTRHEKSEFVPILFQEYRARPTAWPQGQTGKILYFSFEISRNSS